MTFRIRNTPDAHLALIAVNNAMLVDSLSTEFHLSKAELAPGSDTKNPTLAAWTVATADATDHLTAISLLTELQAYQDAHFTDTIAHDTATSAASTNADATDTDSATTVANVMKEDFMVHFTAANVHYTNDDTNTITAADATDEATLLTLVNEIKEQANDHTQSAPSGTWIDIVPA